MNTYYAIFAIPFISVCAVGLLQAWDEIYSKKTQLPVDMDRMVAKVEFGLFQPMMLEANVCEPLGLRAECADRYAGRLTRKPQTILADSEIPTVVVVGKFSVLGALTEVAVVQTELELPLLLPVALPMSIPAWEPNARPNPRTDA